MKLCNECKQDAARTNAGLCISCNEGMIEDLACDAIRYRKRAEVAEAKLKLHAGDVCSLNNEIEQLREQLNDNKT